MVAETVVRFMHARVAIQKEQRRAQVTIDYVSNSECFPSNTFEHSSWDLFNFWPEGLHCHSCRRSRGIQGAVCPMKRIMLMASNTFGAKADVPPEVLLLLLLVTAAGELLPTAGGKGSSTEHPWSQIPQQAALGYGLQSGKEPLRKGRPRVFSTLIPITPEIPEVYRRGGAVKLLPHGGLKIDNP